MYEYSCDSKHATCIGYMLAGTDKIVHQWRQKTLFSLFLRSTRSSTTAQKRRSKFLITSGRKFCERSRALCSQKLSRDCQSREIAAVCFEKVDIKKKHASPSENNFEFQNIPQTRWVNRGLQWTGTEWGKRVDGVGIEGNMKRFADKSQGAAPWLGLFSNFKTRFFDKLAYTLRRWQNPDGLVFIRLFASVGRWPRFYASVRDQLEWID